MHRDLQKRPAVWCQPLQQFHGVLLFAADIATRIAALQNTEMVWMGSINLQQMCMSMDECVAVQMAAG